VVKAAQWVTTVDQQLTTTWAAKAVQWVTTLDQKPIDARKPSPVSTEIVEAEDTVPDSIFHSSYYKIFGY
jgi:hypothetical protein